MGLNIKNQRVHELAREAARRTGRSQTSVIEEALQRLLRELPEDATADGEVWEWFERVQAERTDAQREAARAFEHELFDGETGLPR